jgi:aspartate racemase|tara:strand:- start:402 stop:1073 length:672 start_codon:yes stop_codon:yes gene_type:complete
MKNNIGILGLGVRSTSYYTNLLHQKMHEKYGGYHTFPYLNYQINFNDINPFLPNQFDVLLPHLEKHIVNLKNLNLDKWLVPNITLHEALDKINHGLSLFHPLELAIQNCLKNNIQNVVVFGTNYTMQSNYMKSYFEKESIIVHKATKNEMILIDELRTKIYQSKDKKDDIKNYQKLIENYTKNAHVIIACTELSLLSKEIKSTKIIDLAQLQINEAFNYHINP